MNDQRKTAVFYTAALTICLIVAGIVIATEAVQPARAQGNPPQQLLTALGFNQLPDCSRYGVGNYMLVQKVVTLPKTALNFPAYDCLKLDATLQLTGAKPTLLTIPPPAVVNIGFVYGEIPQGAIDGTNTVFTLANTPNPPTSLQLFRGLGIAEQGVDYTISGNTITFVVPPQATDSLLATQYRIN